MHKKGTGILEEGTLKRLNQKVDMNPNVTAENFRGAVLEYLHMVDRLAEVDVLISNNEVSDKGVTGKLAERSLRTFSSTANLLRFNNHICYVTDVTKVFNWFRCST